MNQQKNYDLQLIRHTVTTEDRGDIFSIWQQDDMKEFKWVEDKVSISHRGVVRGLHGEYKGWKLITCLFGNIRLITYDLRRNLIKGFDIGDGNQVSILLPPGFINGHQCLSRECVFHYKLTEYYTSPKDQISVHYNSLDYLAPWPLVPVCLSERDETAPELGEVYDKIVSRL